MCFVCQCLFLRKIKALLLTPSKALIDGDTSVGGHLRTPDENPWRMYDSFSKKPRPNSETCWVLRFADCHFHPLGHLEFLALGYKVRKAISQVQLPQKGKRHSCRITNLKHPTRQWWTLAPGEVFEEESTETCAAGGSYWSSDLRELMVLKNFTVQLLRVELSKRWYWFIICFRIPCSSHYISHDTGLHYQTSTIMILDMEIFVDQAVWENWARTFDYTYMIYVYTDI